jgi:hypothetical protein
MTILSSRRVLTGALAGLVFGAGVAASINDAEARSRRGAAVAAGIIGGLALGAIAASAARPAYAYPSYGYTHPSYGYGYSGGYYPSSNGYYGSNYYGSNYYGSNYYGGDYGPVAGYGDAYYDAPVCYWQRRRVAIDPYTVVVRRVRVCN